MRKYEVQIAKYEDKVCHCKPKKARLFQRKDEVFLVLRRREPAEEKPDAESFGALQDASPTKGIALSRAKSPAKPDGARNSGGGKPIRRRGETT